MLKKTLFSGHSTQALRQLRRHIKNERTIFEFQRNLWTNTNGICDQRDRNKTNVDCSRCVSTYGSPSGVIFHFDTHKLINKFQENGFSAQQAESITSCLVEIVHSSLSNLASNTVSTLDKERLEMKWKSIYDEVRNEMFLLEKSKFAQVKEENEKLKEKVKALEHLMQEEVKKMKGSIRLDMSLEKSRRSEELAIRDQRIRDNGNKIETEVAWYLAPHLL